jgi:hypothetical protein
MFVQGMGLRTRFGGKSGKGLPVYRAIEDRPERVVWVVASTVETLLALRLGVHLLDAPEIPPVQLLNQVTDPLVAPFTQGLLQGGAQQTLAINTYALQPGSLLAMMVFWLLGWGTAIAVGLATSGREATH